VVELADLVKELQPNAMMCSRVGYGLGDYASVGDMEVPTKKIKGLWETADTNNDSWSYAWYDNNFKSPKVILGRVIETVARGGSYLFNIGPDRNGAIPNIGVEFLEESGNWIKKYPQVVYAAGPSPWGYALPWGDVTTKDKSLFLSVGKWPTDGKLYLPGLNSKVKKVSLLEGSKSSKLKFHKENDWLVINLPFNAPEDLISVIQVDLEDEKADVRTNLGIYPNVATRLLTEFGKAEGAEQKNIRWMEKFGEWKHANQVSNWEENGTVTWEVNVQKPGYYYLDLEYKGDGRLVWKTITDEGIRVQNQQAATNKYAYRRMGILEFKTAGNHTIKTSLVEGDAKTSSLKSILISSIK
jgi:alpha-L-fucosidase